MYINATGFYVPEERVDNQHFLDLNGLTSEWIEQRTGIRSRSKATTCAPRLQDRRTIRPASSSPS